MAYNVSGNKEVVNSMNYDSVNNLGGELQSQVRHQKGIKQKVSGNSSARSRAADFVAIVMCQAVQLIIALCGAERKT